MITYLQLKLGRAKKPVLAFLILSALLMASVVQSGPAFSATLLSADQAAQVVTIRNPTVKEGVVSGELVTARRGSCATFNC